MIGLLSLIVLSCSSPHNPTGPQEAKTLALQHRPTTTDTSIILDSVLINKWRIYVVQYDSITEKRESQKHSLIVSDHQKIDTIEDMYFDENDSILYSNIIVNNKELSIFKKDTCYFVGINSIICDKFLIKILEKKGLYSKNISSRNPFIFKNNYIYSRNFYLSPPAGYGGGNPSDDSLMPILYYKWDLDFNLLDERAAAPTKK